MAQIQWNEAQRRAIDHRGSNLLLSAAAGSGKTATLTERILELIIRDGADISRMLIVTFTRDATAELKARIAGKLTEAMAENPDLRGLQRQIQKLEGAAISTTHSFLLGELRPHFAALGLVPDFSVVDEAVAGEMKREIMLDVVGDFFDAGEGEFLHLADTMGGSRDDESLDAALLSVWDKLMLIGEGPEFLLSDKAEGDFLLSPVASALRDEITSALEHFGAVFERVEGDIASDSATEKYSGGVRYYIEYIRLLKAAVGEGYTKFKTVLSDFGEPDKPRLRNKTDAYIEYMDARRELRELFRYWGGRFFSVSEEKLAEVIDENRRLMRALCEVLSEFEKRFSDAKKERGKVDYNDIERLAVKLFTLPDGSPSPEAVSVGSRFDYIFIDEYQDTNRLQDAVYKAISASSERFMVGDIKQSIYGFRGARPEIFKGYREKYEKLDGGEAVFMSENHRCDSSIIDFSNIVSDYMFRHSETPFDDEDKLVCAKQGGKVDEKCEIVVVKNSEDAGANPEAEYVAERIRSMLGGDVKRDGTPVRPGDIAILMRNRAGAAFKEALEARGVPVKTSERDSFFERPEVLLLCSLLYTVDNPTNDIQLCGVMKSEIFGFTMNDLINIRAGEDCPLWYSVQRYAKGDGELSARASAFIKRLERYRDMAERLDAHKLLLSLIADTGFRAMTDGCSDERMEHSLRVMQSYAISCASDGGTLHDLIVYLEGVMAGDGGEAVPSAQDAVTICTHHASKGLEYPICFIVNTKTAFNTQDAADSVQVDSETGAFMKHTDAGGLVKYDTLLRASAALRATRRNLEEEMRVLYVAMTRAREKLIVTCLAPKKLSKADVEEGIRDTAEKELRASQKRIAAGHTKYSVFSARCPAHFILDAAHSASDRSSFEIKCESAGEMKETDEQKARELSGELVEKYKDMLLERFARKVPRSYLNDIPAKLSVSELHPGVLDCTRDDTEEVETVPAPAFISAEKKVGAAEAGTATHLFMQFCDMDALYFNGVEAEIKRLVDDRFIRRDTADIIRLDELEKFRESKLYSRMRDAKELRREFRFNAMVDACDFTENAELAERLREDGAQICVQGVVDLLFEDRGGKTVLVDYKTDRLTDKELQDMDVAREKLSARHRDQLMTYKSICEEMIGREIDEVLIYSLHLGDTIRLT